MAISERADRDRSPPRRSLCLRRRLRQLEGLGPRRRDLRANRSWPRRGGAALPPRRPDGRRRREHGVRGHDPRAAAPRRAGGRGLGRLGRRRHPVRGDSGGHADRLHRGHPAARREAARGARSPAAHSRRSRARRATACSARSTSAPPRARRPGHGHRDRRSGRQRAHRRLRAAPRPPGHPLRAGSASPAGTSLPSPSRRMPSPFRSTPGSSSTTSGPTRTSSGSWPSSGSPPSPATCRSARPATPAASTSARAVPAASSRAPRCCGRPTHLSDARRHRPLLPRRAPDPRRPGADAGDARRMDGRASLRPRRSGSTSWSPSPRPSGRPVRTGPWSSRSTTFSTSSTTTG